MQTTALKPSGSGHPKRQSAFTLVELLVVIAVIAVLAGILLPTLARSKARAQSIYCLNNAKQLTLAWMMYADDHNGRLAYNLPATGSDAVAKAPNAPSMNLNWANNVLNWTLDPDNTNFSKLVEGAFNVYSKSAPTYRCPSDRVVSLPQRNAGWSQRVRSYAMNAMVGDAGGSSQAGVNIHNPDYLQFFSFNKIPQPANVFVFLDEHPDSIDDGYFVNRAYAPEWEDLPGSYHEGGANFSYADGHAELHRWRSATTKPSAQPGAARLPIRIPTCVEMAPVDLADFYWVISRMSIEHNPAFGGSMD